MAKPDLNRFLTALTATDVLGARERSGAASDERKRIKDDCWAAEMFADAAFHRAMAAQIESGHARVSHSANAAEMTAAATLAVFDAIDRVDVLMGMPCVRKGDVSERRALLRRWRSCAVGSHYAAWLERQEAWLARLDGVEGRMPVLAGRAN